MRKRCKTIITTFALCGGLVIGFNTTKLPIYASEAINTVITNDENGIPDKNLYNALLEELDSNNDGILTKEEASESQYVLNLDEKNITNLKGIDNIKGFRIITLNDNNITDISPLADLKDLEIIHLNQNNISDISILSNFQKL